MADQKFPIYRFTAKWVQDGIHNPAYPNGYKGLPDGRVWNGTSGTKMFREEQTEEQLQTWLETFWAEHQKHQPHENVADLELKSEFLGRETWVLTWFQHETFDVGQTDEEALASFAAFVEEKEELNRKYRMTTGKEDDAGPYCLMGAEERWRWHGAGENGDSDERTPAPCRCKFCKEQGKLRIGH